MRIREKYSRNPVEFAARGLRVVRPLGTGSFCDAWVVRCSSSSNAKNAARDHDDCASTASTSSSNSTSTSTTTCFAVKKVADCDRARREVSILSSLNHLNITRFVSWFCGDGQGTAPSSSSSDTSTATPSPASPRSLYLVMEYAKGGDLSDRIRWHQQKRTSVPEDVVMEYAVQVGLALRYIHAQGVIHRDIKPKNIFLTAEGVIKVGDFGLATRAESTAQSARKEIASRNRSMTLCGSPLYTAPEIVCRRPYSSKVDIWSFGVVLFELLTLRLPFESASRQELFAQICGSRRISPDDIDSTYSQGLRALCADMLQVSAEERPAAEVLISSPFMQGSLPVVADSLRSRLPAVAVPAVCAASAAAEGGGGKSVRQMSIASSGSSCSIDTADTPDESEIRWGNSAASASPRLHESSSFVASRASLSPTASPRFPPGASLFARPPLCLDASLEAVFSHAD